MGLEEAILKEVHEQSPEQGIKQKKQFTAIRGFSNELSIPNTAGITA